MDKSYTRLILVVLLCLAVFLFVQLQRSKTGLEQPSKYEFPIQFNKWQGQDIHSDNELWMSGLGASKMVFRSYHKGNASIDLYLAYYTDMNSSDLVHAPTVCYPGQGWKVESDSVEVFSIGTTQFRANRIIIQKQGQTQIVYAWWQTPGKIIATNTGHRLYQLLSSIMFSNSASVWSRVSIDATHETMSEDERHLKAFIHDVVHLVENYFSHRQSE